MSDLRSLFRTLGGIFILVGFITLICLVVPLYFGEYGSNCKYDAITPILITSAVFFCFGFPFYYLFRKADHANYKSAMITAALAWIIVPAIGIIPLILIPYNKETLVHMSPLSAFFESMSGWTGTGLTMVDKENLIPYTLQFWRSFIQWIGGVGVIVLTLSILARPGTGSFVLYKGEARSQKTHPSVVSTVRTIWWIFLLYTIIGVIALTIIGFVTSDGMTPWESLNHAMTAIATGGFGVTDDSITSFGAISQIVILILMVLGAIAFAAHYDLLKGHIKKFLSDVQFKAIIALIIMGVIGLTYINLKLPEVNGNILYSLKISGFQFTSAITTTGFQSVNVIGSPEGWSEIAVLILACAMIIGGAAGSTAGGIKLFRAVLLYDGVSWRIKRATSTPHRVFVHKLGDRYLKNDEAMDLINEAAIISFIWVIFLFVGIFVLGVVYINEANYRLSDIIFEVCSAQGNAGLTTGITHMGMPSIAKIMLIFNMWIGRLEIIPVIVLVRSLFGLKRNIR
ncbi:MAG: TrkH family potassium uptake protein [Candidatus Thermoplasmatota archaeon]|nr:TrkH family potassium uptake protein [Candidatus Thermoplasmatota archaeon]